MLHSSTHLNLLSSPVVHMALGDGICRSSYDLNMPRKADHDEQTGPDWYLREWLEATGFTQAKLQRACGWSKGTANNIYHGKTSYYRQILNEVSAALGIHPHELLMHPADAMAIRNIRESVARIAAETRTSYVVETERDGTFG